MPLKIAEETTMERGWLGRVYARLETYEDTDPKPFGPLIVSFCVYVFIALAVGSRALWHDELYTYYIAKSATLQRFIAALEHVDLQPPLLYMLSRISLAIFGDSALATRFPSILGFAVASICLYHFVRRRLGRFYGLAAMLVLWLSPFLYFAGEARPYSLVLGFLGLAMLGWQTAIEGQRRRLGLLALGFGVWGMLVSQALSPVLVAILGMAEVVRSLDRRKIDWLVWIALLAPTPFVLLYIPMFRRFEGWTALPPEFQASYFKIIAFYAELLASVGVTLLIALTVALLAYRSPGERYKEQIPRPRKHEIALVLGLLSLPIVINLMLMRTGGAFWPRYCMATAIGFSLLFVSILARLTNSSRAAAAIVSVIVIVGIVMGTALQVAHPHDREMIKRISLQQLDPRFPLVDASGLTFLEMNKREDAALLARVFYLTDHDAAMKYAHATIFEGAGVLREYFPIRGSVAPYRDFIRQSPHFFVLGTPDYVEDWLIPKLMDDGAELNFIGETGGSYKDHMVFEVIMSPEKAGR